MWAIGSRGELISNTDCPIECAAHFPSIVGLCVHILSGADGDGGDGDDGDGDDGDGDDGDGDDGDGDDGDGDGVGDGNYSTRST